MKPIDEQLDKIDQLIGNKIFNLRMDGDMSRSDLAKKAVGLRIKHATN
jgi:hypothetical protein